MTLAREASEEICHSVNSLESSEKKYLCYRFGYPSDDEVNLHENGDATRVLQ